MFYVLPRYPLWVLWCKMGARSWEGEVGICCLLRAFDLTCHCTIYVLIYGPKGTLHHVQVFTLSACLSEHMTILLKSGIIKKTINLMRIKQKVVFLLLFECANKRQLCCPTDKSFHKCDISKCQFPRLSSKHLGPLSVFLFQTPNGSVKCRLA